MWYIILTSKKHLSKNPSLHWFKETNIYLINIYLNFTVQTWRMKCMIGKQK